MSILHHRDRCRLCDSAAVQKVVEISPIPLAEKYADSPESAREMTLYPVDLYMCEDCGHVQILDVIDPEVLWADYTYHSGQTPGLVEHFRNVAHNLVDRYRPTDGALAVDIGSNDGTLLSFFRDQGFSVLGVDPALEIARGATARGIETIPELMSLPLANRVVEERGQAGIVLAFNSFAHTDDMHELADSIRCLLRPDGIFVFECQYLLDVVEKNLLGTIFHEHMCHHSVLPLQRFLQRHGMELIAIERKNIQHGSLLGVAQLLGGPRPVEESVAELMALEDAKGLNRLEVLREFDARLKQMRNKAQELLAECRREKKVIAAFGAARSGPTFINQLGLGGHISVVFDDHPQKVGKYTPGDGIAVLPTQKLSEIKPDYLVILAWIHGAKIMANNASYLEEGGCFVLCCPDVEIVTRH
ncbi:MAG: class I SAM-dependent methyltransferase [Candidatus Eremiobacteraeota bacterium]|nr:class I SAM-dependent methyltransferase [Candidatus Eremiobacteraeota bacterium]